MITAITAKCGVVLTAMKYSLCDSAMITATTAKCGMVLTGRNTASVAVQLTDIPRLVV